MLTVYRDTGDGTIRDAEYYFDRNLTAFDLGRDGLLEVLYGAHLRDDGKIQTKLGICKPVELPTYMKLAFCLMQRPMELFFCKGCSTLELEKILKLPQGRLLVRLNAPIEYSFPIEVVTMGGTVLKSSDELNNFMFSPRSAVESLFSCI